MVGAKSRTYEGSGIGLALVQELVKLHDGTIKAQSKIKKGTIFIIRIPKGIAHLPKESVSKVKTRSFRIVDSDVFIHEYNAMAYKLY